MRLSLTNLFLICLISRLSWREDCVKFAAKLIFSSVKLCNWKIRWWVVKLFYSSRALLSSVMWWGMILMPELQIRVSIPPSPLVQGSYLVKVKNSSYLAYCSTSSLCTTRTLSRSFRSSKTERKHWWLHLFLSDISSVASRITGRKMSPLSTSVCSISAFSKSVIKWSVHSIYAH